MSDRTVLYVRSKAHAGNRTRPILAKAFRGELVLSEIAPVNQKKSIHQTA